ncbi:MAG: fimbrillin family protein, partial [Bacteroides sp.]|nr:fimbrillin family protein [Bacteroides sp.]
MKKKIQKAAGNALNMKAATLMLIVTAACMLPAACTNDDLNSPDPARTPLAITEIGIGGSNLNASSATRIATNPTSGAQTWEEGDAIRVFATLKDGANATNPTTKSATSTYIYKVGEGWTQTPVAGEATLYVDDVQSVSRVETYGGRTQYDPATDYLMQADPGAGGNPSTTGNPGTAAGNPGTNAGNPSAAAGSGTYTSGDNYRLNDLLADDSPVLGGSTNGSPARNSFSATLAHRRVDLVLCVADGAAAPSTHALPAGAYLLVTISGNRTITAWFAGKTKDEDSASPTAGREASTFRALVEPEDVPGISVDNATGADPAYSLPAGAHELGTLVYPDPTDAA